MSARARVVLHCVVFTLRRVRRRRRREIIEILAGDAQMRVGIARHQAEIELLGDIKSKFRRGGEIIVVIIDALLPRREQIQRRNRRGAGMKMFDVRRVVKLLEGTADAAGLVECIEGSGFDAGVELGRPRPALGDDVDDAADGIGAVQAALRTAQDFNRLNVLGEKLTQVEGAAGIAGIADINSVDQHLGMIRIRAANEHRGLAAGPTGLHHVQSWN
jgi:hypothetical protein